MTNSYRLETQSKLKQVEELSDPDKPRVFHVTQCASCGGQLDLPSVHFMCNHSYHQRYVHFFAFSSLRACMLARLPFSVSPDLTLIHSLMSPPFFIIANRCLGEHDTECPSCARAHALVREIRRNNERLADQHDVFLSEVREGGFAALAAGFARGTMNMTRLEDMAT